MNNSVSTFIPFGQECKDVMEDRDLITKWDIYDLDWGSEMDKGISVPGEAIYTKVIKPHGDPNHCLSWRNGTSPVIEKCDTESSLKEEHVWYWEVQWSHKERKIKLFNNYNNCLDVNKGHLSFYQDKKTKKSDPTGENQLWQYGKDAPTHW
jgi:hypothetical protein